MIISEMRESASSPNKNVNQAPDNDNAPRRSLRKRFSEKAHNVRLIIGGSIYLLLQGVAQAYRWLWVKIQNKKSAVGSAPVDVTPTDTKSVEVTDVERDSAAEERPIVTELPVKEKEQSAPNVFQRLTLKGSLLEGALIREEYGTTHEMGDKNSLIILATRAYINVRRFVRGAADVAGKDAEAFFQKALEQGELDAQAWSGRWTRIGNNADVKMRGLRKSFWNSLGLVDKAEVDKLSAEIYRLAGKKGPRKMAPLSMIATHDRRHAERRKAYLTVAYERRSMERRA